MTNQNEATPEQYQQAIQARNAEKESYAFMRKHIQDFSPCEANSSLLTVYLQENNLPWTQDSLETAYEACKQGLVKATPADRPQLDLPSAPAADDLPPSPPNVVWPTNKQEINNMSQTDYRREFHSTKTGQQFRNRINFILQRGL